MDEIFTMEFKQMMEEQAIRYSKSTERVYREMKRASKPLKSVEIASMAKLTDRTVRTALQKLYRAKLVKKVPNFTDMRSHYHIAL